STRRGARTRRRSSPSSIDRRAGATRRSSRSTRSSTSSRRPTFPSCGRFAFHPRRGGRAPELDRRGTLEHLGRYIARIHTVGAGHAFAQRPTLTVEAFGDDARAYLLEHGFVPDDLVVAWTAIVDMALAAVRRALDRMRFDVLRVHGDCHASNVLWTDDWPHFVDFDDARMAPAIQDLWMLLSGSRASMEEQL